MRSRGVYIHETCLVGILDTRAEIAGGDLACDRCEQHGARAKRELAAILTGMLKDDIARQLRAELGLA